MNSLQKEKSPATPSEIHPSSEYVDIFYIGHKVGLFFQNAKRLFIRNILLIVGLAALGFGLGYALHKNTTPYYSSSMVISTGDLKPMIARTLLGRLSADISDESYEVLAQKLKVPVETAQTIQKLSVTGYIDEIKEEAEQDSTLSQVNLQVTDVTRFAPLQAALVNYIESTEAYKLGQNLNRTQTLAFMERINKDIRKIDSLKTLDKEGSRAGTVVIYGENERAAELFKQGNDLYRQQMALENYLVLQNRVRVIAPFTPRTKPSGPSLAMYEVIGSLLGALVAFLIAVKRDQKARLAFAE